LARSSAFRPPSLFDSRQVRLQLKPLEADSSAPGDLTPATPAPADGIVAIVPGFSIARNRQPPEGHRDDFTIELRRDVSSGDAITFTDSGRAGGHLRQLALSSPVNTDQRAGSPGSSAVIADSRSSLAQRGRQLDALSTLFPETDLFLRAGENELSYGVNLGESDAGMLQFNRWMRNCAHLEGKLEKSLAAQAEIEHRQQQIAAELNKGFEPAARYEELKLRLNVLNQELTKADTEIEASPELSNLDDDAFRHVESGVSTHQIRSLVEELEETISKDALAMSNVGEIAAASVATGTINRIRLAK